LQAKATFYDVLIDGSGNDELRRILRGLHARATLVRATSLSQPGRPRHSVEELKAIARAAEARDAEKTARLCIEHIERAEAAALSGGLPEN
jgi:GntR family transcriptional regulator, trigonelline degradation regulator